MVTSSIQCDNLLVKTFCWIKHSITANGFRLSNYYYGFIFKSSQICMSMSHRAHREHKTAGTRWHSQKNIYKYPLTNLVPFCLVFISLSPLKWLCVASASASESLLSLWTPTEKIHIKRRQSGTYSYV